MSVIIYGTRDYGVVDQHAGEHAQSTFFHIWFLPLFPVGSTWITHEAGGEKHGHAIKLYGKSVAAAYLRVWGPIVALVAFGSRFETGAVASLAIAAIAVALSAWSWTWRSLRGDRAKRRSDFNYVAFGTRVDPHRLDAATRADLQTALDQQWNARAPKQSPNEIAHHGTANPAEAVLAYGLLRLAAIARKGKGEEAADAERILDGDHVPSAVEDGPYRAGVAAPARTTAIDELVAARAAVDAQSYGRAAPPQGMDKDDARRRRRRYRAGLVVASILTLSGAMLFAKAVEPYKPVTLSELRSIKPPTGHVRVTCDSVEGPIWQETSRDGDVESQIAMCTLGGKYYLPIKLRAKASVPQGTVEGNLRHLPESALWVKDGLRREPQIEAATLEVYLDTATRPLIEIVLGAAMVLCGPLAWLLYFRWKRQNRALLAK